MKVTQDMLKQQGNVAVDIMSTDIDEQSLLLDGWEQKYTQLETGPFEAKISSLAVIGPLADDGYEQLGTWVFDAKPSQSITCLNAIKKHVGDSVDVSFSKGLETSRSINQEGFIESQIKEGFCNFSPASTNPNKSTV